MKPNFMKIHLDLLFQTIRKETLFLQQPYQENMLKYVLLFGIDVNDNQRIEETETVEKQRNWAAAATTVKSE